MALYFFVNEKILLIRSCTKGESGVRSLLKFEQRFCRRFQRVLDLIKAIFWNKLRSFKQSISYRAEKYLEVQTLADRASESYGMRPNVFQIIKNVTRNFS